MSRIKIYKDKYLHVGYVVGAFASVWSVIVTIWLQFWSLSWWLTVPSVIVIALALIAVWAVVKSDTPTRRFLVEDTEGIRKYLSSWIEHGSRVVIWTRDMSWASNERMKELLVRKAQRNELIICLPKDIEISNYLKGQGAEVIAYGTVDAPETRFTIVNFGRAGSRVAVGGPSGNLHIIQEFSSGEHPAFHMAEDLVRLVRESNNAGG